MIFGEAVYCQANHKEAGTAKYGSSSLSFRGGFPGVSVKSSAGTPLSPCPLPRLLQGGKGKPRINGTGEQQRKVDKTVNATVSSIKSVTQAATVARSH
ncbi:hypothetical protein TYRP_020146 [Tyrophagus putrescentiae]|nr:hypothetical protein TYRP_020146 [Tyrophagus putrescentiae]